MSVYCKSEDCKHNEYDWCTLQWVSVKKDGFPKEEGQYLCLVEHKFYYILSFAKKLKSVDKYAFEGCNRKGFYDYDSEWGYCWYSDVSHWMPLPKLPSDI